MSSGSWNDLCARLPDRRPTARKLLGALAVNRRIEESTGAKASGEHTAGLAPLASIAIGGVVIAMGRRAMGIADEIAVLAFGLSLGAVAVAVALSFSLGGREAAAKLTEHWLSRWRRD